MKQIFKKLLIATLICFVLTINAFSQSDKNVQKENVIAQMNYCINSLSNIINNNSMSVLEHESDQILNNLTMEQIIGLYEINDFRIDLLDAVSKFDITEQERNLLRRIQSIKRNNLKWSALSNALDPTMLLTGNTGPGMGYQLAFQMLLTAARSAVEYQTLQGDQNIEELRAMWDLRKEDLKQINDLRKDALKIIFSLYEKYHLSEKDRLTEATANNFITYISEIDAAKRARLLEDNRSVYESMADYYYYLGMAYLDLNKYDKAKVNFNIYLNLYKKAPLLRYDEKSGCIALAILANEKELADREKKQFINIALQNLPHNSAATLQCALIYLKELNLKEESLRLIRAGIEDPKASDRPLLYMAAANLLPLSMQYSKLNSEINGLFAHNSGVSLDSYITYIINSGHDVWKNISNLIVLEKVYYRRWYQLWIGKYFNENFQIIIPEGVIYDSGDISIYVENHKSGVVTIKQLQTSFLNGVSVEDLDEIDCFRANKELKYLYFDVLVPEKYFILKKDIDFNAIKMGEWSRQSEFALSDGDIKDIIDFCKDNTPEKRGTQLECKYWDRGYVNKGVINYAKIRFCGGSLKYKPNHSVKQVGRYVRIVFSNGINLMYKFDAGELKPYMYSKGDKMFFVSNTYRVEYQYIGNQEPSWWFKVWSYVTNLFSNNDDSSANATKAVESKRKTVIEKTSWWVETWSFITGLFSSDNKDQETESAAAGNQNKKKSI